MKTFRFILTCTLLSFANLLLSQNTLLPGADLYTLEGKRVNTSDISENKGLTVVLFWNMNDPESIEQLVNMNEANDDPAKGQNVKIIGVCTDLTGYMQNIRPFIAGKAIAIDIYIDKNNELKRLMSVPATPFTILFDNKTNKQEMVMGNFDNILGMARDIQNDHLASEK